MVLKLRKMLPDVWSHYFLRSIYLVAIVLMLHYCQTSYFKEHVRYRDETGDLVEPDEPSDYVPLSYWYHQQLFYEISHLRKEISQLKQRLTEVEAWKEDLNINESIRAALDAFYLDQIGLLDYAAEYSGGYIISTPDTIPYPAKNGIRLFGTFDWLSNSQPSWILQHATFPGKCFAFYGDKGIVRVGLGRPVVITHVSLEHLRLEAAAAAPKQFQVLGVANSGLVNLGHFTYDLTRPVIQTFAVQNKNQTFQAVEVRILSNYGDVELTCVYRFRVHSVNVNLK